LEAEANNAGIAKNMKQAALFYIEFAASNLR
jgi:hypothetical protein